MSWKNVRVNVLCAAADFDVSSKLPTKRMNGKRGWYFGRASKIKMRRPARVAKTTDAAATERAEVMKLNT